MTKPNYQPIVDKNIPVVDIHDALADIGINSGNGGEACAAESVGKVRVIAGSFHGMKGPASTFSPVELWDVSMSKNATVDFPFPELYNCIIFVRRGKIDILGADDEKSRVGPQAVALTEKNGAIVRIRSEDPETSILIMGGLPLNEPIAARGPFVMNTWDEIAQASRDYQLGNFGS